MIRLTDMKRPCVMAAEDLSFRYGGDAVFAGVGFKLYQGDFAAIIGSNGTGKSTLLRLILGELNPDNGGISLFGQELSRFRDWPRVGYVSQQAIQAMAGFPATVEEIVMANLFAQIGLLRFPKREHREKAMAALKFVGMEGYAKRMIGNLSGGQQQRVMLARMLAGEPELMLLDEPTTGVDGETVRAVYELLSRLNRERGITILMVTHDILRASQVVSRILCLEDGSLLELDQAQLDEELSHRHRHPHVHLHGRKGGD